VALGRAIVRQPRAFLFDEPLSNLDASLRGQVRVELKRLHQELGATMVYVTHDQVEAMTLADRIAVLKGGTLQQVGSPADLFHAPANKFVAGFIGSPPMNFFDARYRKADNSVHGDGFELTLRSQMLRAGLGETPIEIGWRPTSFAPTDGEAPCSGIVDVIESLGHESCLHLDVGRARAMAIVPEKCAVPIERGAAVRFTVPPEEIHVFDKATGRAIRPDDAAEN